jgi:hypothetical protein
LLNSVEIKYNFLIRIKLWAAEQGVEISYAIDIVWRYGLKAGRLGLVPWREQAMFLFLQRPDRLWGSRDLSSGCRGQSGGGVKLTISIYRLVKNGTAASSLTTRPHVMVLNLLSTGTTWRLLFEVKGLWRICGPKREDNHQNCGGRSVKWTQPHPIPTFKICSLFLTLLWSPNQGRWDGLDVYRALKGDEKHTIFQLKFPKQRGHLGGMDAALQWNRTWLKWFRTRPRNGLLNENSLLGFA